MTLPFVILLLAASANSKRIFPDTPEPPFVASPGDVETCALFDGYLADNLTKMSDLTVSSFVRNIEDGLYSKVCSWKGIVGLAVLVLVIRNWGKAKGMIRSILDNLRSFKYAWVISLGLMLPMLMTACWRTLVAGPEQYAEILIIGKPMSGFIAVTCFVTVGMLIYIMHHNYKEVGSFTFSQTDGKQPVLRVDFLAMAVITFSVGCKIVLYLNATTVVPHSQTYQISTADESLYWHCRVASMGSVAKTGMTLGMFTAGKHLTAVGSATKPNMIPDEFQTLSVYTAPICSAVADARSFVAMTALFAQQEVMALLGKDSIGYDSYYSCFLFYETEFSLLCGEGIVAILFCILASINAIYFKSVKIAFYCYLSCAVASIGAMLIFWCLGLGRAFGFKWYPNNQFSDAQVDFLTSFGHCMGNAIQASFKLVSWMFISHQCDVVMKHHNSKKTNTAAGLAMSFLITVTHLADSEKGIVALPESDDDTGYGTMKKSATAPTEDAPPPETLVTFPHLMDEYSEGYKGDTGHDPSTGKE